MHAMLCGAVLLGLDMAVPLYPGPPSFELGLELTGVGIYFDGKGELGSLIKVTAVARTQCTTTCVCT
jgi:hypothetical protein